MYEYTIYCGNCGRVQVVEIPKGTRANAFIRDLICPNCGCKVLLEDRQDIYSGWASPILGTTDSPNDYTYTDYGEHVSKEDPCPSIYQECPSTTINPARDDYTYTE